MYVYKKLHMQNYEKNFQFSVGITPLIESICVPLIQNLGIKHFIYKRMFLDFSHIMLSTCTKEYFTDYYDLVEQDVRSKFLYSHLCQSPPKSFYYAIWPQDINFDCVMSLNYKHEVFNGITLCYRQEEYVDTYSFILPNNIDHSSTINFFLNNLDILKEFAIYFQNTAYHLIYSDIHQDKIIVPKTKRLIIFEELTHSKKSIKPLIQSKLILHNEKASLTKRETEIAYLLAHGQSTAKEIAKTINISTRTVECYIEHLKNKLKCYNKVELIRRLKEYLLCN